MSSVAEDSCNTPKRLEMTTKCTVNIFCLFIRKIEVLDHLDF